MSLTNAQEVLVQSLRECGIRVYTDAGHVHIIPSTEGCLWIRQVMKHIHVYARMPECAFAWQKGARADWERAEHNIGEDCCDRLLKGVAQLQNVLYTDTYFYPNAVPLSVHYIGFIGDLHARIGIPTLYAHCAACMTLTLALQNPTGRLHRWVITASLATLLNGHEAIS